MPQFPRLTFLPLSPPNRASRILVLASSLLASSFLPILFYLCIDHSSATRAQIDEARWTCGKKRIRGVANQRSSRFWIAVQSLAPHVPLLIVSLRARGLHNLVASSLSSLFPHSRGRLPYFSLLSFDLRDPFPVRPHSILIFCVIVPEDWVVDRRAYWGDFSECTSLAAICV